ncbi:hypothetical protein MNB_SV-3-990 [hydrothermal vent metagenome]|uniref:Uncharacterized protein n=1 Tax=hydrothermal vent metagenome TaxID=652676 RepID=A0A1W1BXN7_9ZZZZ
MKVKGLRIPEDVEVELCVDGEVNFSFHSNKGQEKVSQMGEIEKLKFAIAVIAKQNRLK